MLKANIHGAVCDQLWGEMQKANIHGVVYDQLWGEKANIPHGVVSGQSDIQLAACT